MKIGGPVKLKWLSLGRHALLGLAAFAATGAEAQPSSICQVAVTAIIATELELQEAKKVLRRCERAGRTSCATERGRIRNLRQQLKPLRNLL